MTQIPFIDLQAQQKIIRPQIEKRLRDVLDHGNYIMGPEVFELEARLADFVGVKHCISVSSGTDALLMALMAHGVGPGDVIFTTPFTFVATAEVVSLLGATPVFVDIDPQTYNVCPGTLEKTITKFVEEKGNDLTPRGIIPVDLFGLPADYDAINMIARKFNLFVIEDGAQGFGGIYKGRPACSLADIATTSFFPAKPLGGYGDGGAIFLSDDEMAARLRSIRVHGQGSDKYENIRIGLNGRLDTFQAAVLLPKIEIFPDEIKERQRVAHSYQNHLEKIPGILPPFVPEGYLSAWAQYSILTDRREPLQIALKNEGIPTAIYYPKPLHRQTAFSRLGYQAGDFPVSEDVAARVLSLPMHPYLEDRDINRICGCISAFV